MKRLSQHFFFLLLLTFVIFSCKKESNSAEGLFYGSWKTSYGDTIEFFRQDDRNVLRYDYSMNPSNPTKIDQEYFYHDDKLGLKRVWAGTSGTLYTFQSFRWIQKGQVFEVRGVEWFNFISSTQTVFNFTKIE